MPQRLQALCRLPGFPRCALFYAVPAGLQSISNPGTAWQTCLRDLVREAFHLALVIRRTEQEAANGSQNCVLSTVVMVGRIIMGVHLHKCGWLSVVNPKSRSRERPVLTTLNATHLQLAGS